MRSSLSLSLFQSLLHATFDNYSGEETKLPSSLPSGKLGLMAATLKEKKFRIKNSDSFHIPLYIYIIISNLIKKNCFNINENVNEKLLSFHCRDPLDPNNARGDTWDPIF